MEEIFENDRFPISDFDLYEVKADGACLYRSLSNAIFYYSKHQISILKRKFIDSGYFYPEDYGNFLDDYDGLEDCFMEDEFSLNDELEEAIAMGIQRIILNFVRENGKLNVIRNLNRDALPDESILLEDLIFICHEIPIETYLKNYLQFAGDDDFVVNEIVDEVGEKKEEMIEVKNRWGGTPEIVIFSLLFNFNINVFVPQKLIKKTNQIINLFSVPQNKNDIFVKKIDSIKSFVPNAPTINLLLRPTKGSSHYDYLICKN